MFYLYFLLCKNVDNKVIFYLNLINVFLKRKFLIKIFLVDCTCLLNKKASVKIIIVRFFLCIYAVSSTKAVLAASWVANFSLSSCVANFMRLL